MVDQETERLVAAVMNATRDAFVRLVNKTGEHFYYLTLTVFESAAPPRLSAWSWEALDRCEAGNRIDVKWSYADSPYCGFAADAFEQVDALLAQRGNIYELDDAAFEAETEYRMAAYEEAIRRLDREGAFGSGDARLRVAVLVEVMPPDTTNINRARRLNPSEAIAPWLSEAAE